jgi:hypothetical protein
MRLTWGVVTLRKIVMNMHTWASRLLKPRIQACVLQALTMPFVRLEPALPTPDVDIASSEISNTPVLVARSNSSNCSSSSTPTLRADGYGSSDALDGKLVDVSSHLASPSPLASRVSRQGRRLATPRRRLSPATRPTHGMTPDVVHSQTTSSGPHPNTNEEQATAISTTSPAIGHSESQQVTKKADVNSLTRSLEAVQLGDPAPGKNASNQGTPPNRTMSDPPPNSDSHLEARSDNIDARRSRCFQYLVEYKGRLLRMIESLDSLREGGQGPFPQRGVQDNSEGSTPSKYLFEVETYADT